jgi:hypothetical protein
MEALWYGVKPEGHKYRIPETHKAIMPALQNGRNTAL